MPKNKAKSASHVAALTSADVAYVAKLAHLPLSKEDVKKFRHQLSNILDFASQIENLNTGAALVSYQASVEENRFRNDEIDTTRVLSQDEALSGAKKKHNGLFVIPAIFNKQ